ncbi:hypothetical protein HYC85_009033 [Camellia sinensis]|uniref:Uncharacterized protein n=1 Tax=Camellia sinensis TaxID=4442 RepID=A0A7J7HUW1_CAMSI|nr:hypothetical protein HYC85_009033 [Camellia sinensis]
MGKCDTIIETPEDFDDDLVSDFLAEATFSLLLPASSETRVDDDCLQKLKIAENRVIGFGT